ncbi:hypothetical protein TNCT_614501 [Trichonephila clavata]|uniref:Uncharacterized protein n=1 Tax=Trichonephila clavata TaxID=2740835 RepID=A0A8X6IXS7_TRICU|nr:hypothetical protein TNCT_614501 [Trichonephila clavata]
MVQSRRYQPSARKVHPSQNVAKVKTKRQRTRETNDRLLAAIAILVQGMWGGLDGIVPSTSTPSTHPIKCIRNRIFWKAPPSSPFLIHIRYAIWF